MGTQTVDSTVPPTTSASPVSTVPSTTTASTTTVPTTTAASTTTTSPVVDLPLVLSASEARAVALSDASLVATWGTGQTVFSGETAGAVVAVDGPTEFTFRYFVDGQDAGVSWDQVIDPVRPAEVAQPWRATSERRCSVTLPDGTAEPVALVWQSLGDRNSYVAQLDATGEAVNVVSPIWWFIQADGGMSSQVDARYVDDVHARNVAIWPAIAGLDADANAVAFSTAERRSDLAARLSSEAESIGADGINLDIEGYRDADAANFLLFVEELVPLVHAWGGVVSYDVIPRSDAWLVTPDELSFWSTAPDRRGLSAAVDCMVLMAYDQHNRFRPAGPVASPQWVLDQLGYLLRYADPDQIVLGLPFYGRIWDPDRLDAPRARGVGTIDALVGDGVEVTFDETFGLDKVTLGDGRFFWAETPDVLADRLDLVTEHELAGWAAWRLGFDSPKLWQAFADLR